MAAHCQRQSVMRNVKHMRIRRCRLTFCLTLVWVLITGCATVERQDYVKSANHNSCWVDPNVPLDDDMTLPAKIAYYVWWPLLTFASGFQAQSP